MNDIQDNPESLLAAIDLGSNSFHLIIAKSDFGELRPVQALAEKVQLGETSSTAMLTPGAIERGLACLERFKQLIDSTAPAKLRIVGTNALRRAKNRQDFIEPAEQILGAPIDVIYGREEARLIYLGVAHTLSDDEDTRLVVDIGGGSTEFILGERFEPLRLESLQMGCVSYGEAFFPMARSPRSVSMRPIIGRALRSHTFAATTIADHGRKPSDHRARCAPLRR